MSENPFMFPPTRTIHHQSSTAMTRVICRLAFRESGVYIAPVVATLFGYVLLKLDPLRYFDPAVTVLAALLGFFLAWRTFADYGNVRAFLFSRVFTPRRFFLVRWLFGLGIISGVGIIFALFLALGIRQAVQQFLFQNGWFPMIRFEEFRVLPCYGFVSLFTYHSTLYFMLVNRFRSKIRRKGLHFWLRGAATVLLILFGVAAAFFPLAVVTVGLFTESGYGLELIPFLYLIFGLPVLIQLILAPWFGIYCYCNQEIES